MIARMCMYRSLKLNSACVCVFTASKAPYFVPLLLCSSSRPTTLLLQLLHVYTSCSTQRMQESFCNPLIPQFS